MKGPSDGGGAGVGPGAGDGVGDGVGAGPGAGVGSGDGAGAGPGVGDGSGDGVGATGDGDLAGSLHAAALIVSRLMTRMSDFFMWCSRCGVHAARWPGLAVIGQPDRVMSSGSVDGVGRAVVLTTFDGRFAHRSLRRQVAIRCKIAREICELPANA